MITSKNIISIDLKDPWFDDGLEYALKSWTSTFNRMGKPNPYNRIEKILIGLIAERAVEEYLTSINVKYETHGKTKWYEEDRYDLGISEYAVDVKSNFLDTSSPYIQSKYSNLFTNKLDWFLTCHSLVPLDQFNPGNNKRRAHKRDKIYVFPFIEGNFSETSYGGTLIHTFWDYRWLKKAEHKDLPSLGKLKFSYKGSKTTARVKIYGTTAKKTICIETLSLSKASVTTKNEYFQVFSIEWLGDPPNGQLKIETQYLNLSETIKPEGSFSLEKQEKGYRPSENNWQNLAIHDCKIFLLGWILEEEFRIIGKKKPRFSHDIEQYTETQVDNWGCLISELEPIAKIGG